MPTLRVGIWEILRISHYKSRFVFIFIRARTYTRGNSPNLGHFSRDLGQNLRVTFRDRTPIWPIFGHRQGGPVDFEKFTKFGKLEIVSKIG